jgi:hypothetical protein
VFVATCCDPQEGKATEDIVAQPDMATLITGPPHFPVGATTSAIALMSARECVELLTSHHAALTSAQAFDWQTAMQHEHDSLMDNGTWELVDLHADRTVVNSMWIYKINSDTWVEVSRFKAHFVAK